MCCPPHADDEPPRIKGDHAMKNIRLLFVFLLVGLLHIVNVGVVHSVVVDGQEGEEPATIKKVSPP